MYLTATNGPPLAGAFVPLFCAALDGLATVAPVRDPDWIPLRGANALLTSGENAALPLDALAAIAQGDRKSNTRERPRGARRSCISIF